VSEQKSGFSLDGMTNQQENGEGGTGENLLATLVGEGKKYKTMEDLAKSKLEGDLFIDTLKTENRAYREALLSGDETAIEAARAALAAKSKGDPTTQQKSNQPQPPSSLSKADILSIVDERDRTLAARNNVDQFNSVVAQAFGDKANDAVRAKLAELGIPHSELTKLVETSPKAAMRMLGIEPVQKQTQQLGKGEAPVNTAAFFANDGSKTENWAFFQKLRKELKADYYRPEVQKRVMDARTKMGPAFWS
jgi:hypothetical protein